jgi:exodeoxyribonuclease-5
MPHSSSAQPLFICATARLAQHLRARPGCGLRPGEVIDTPQAQTLNQWLEGLHQEARLRGLWAGERTQPVVLDAYQEQLLWEQVIEAQLAEQALALFDISNLARNAMEAHALSVTWQVPVEEGAATPEARSFAIWQADFLKLTAARGWIDQARLQAQVVEGLARFGRDITLPSQVVFAGFASFSPLEQGLRKVLSELGRLGENLVAAPQARAESRPYPDARSEVLAAATWARDTLAQKPDARLALVVPDLAASRNLVQDTLEDVLMPHAVWASQGHAARPFNISLGQPLAQLAMVDTALQLLGLLGMSHRIEQETLGALLRSPFWSQGTHEAAARALLDAGLRKRMGPAAALRHWVSALQSQMERPGPRGAHLAAPLLSGHLQAIVRAADQARAQRLPSAWAEFMAGYLHEAGWLFSRTLDSHEYQARRAFLESVSGLARLDELLGPVGFHEAHRHVTRMSRERIFQPETRGQPRLQVLGLLEASGLEFDGLWVMGMHEGVWPPPAKPNPMLSREWQRKRQVPNASPEVQLKFATEVHASWRACAPKLVCSWAKTEAGAERRPSALIVQAPPQPVPDSPPEGLATGASEPHWSAKVLAQAGTHLLPPMEDHHAPVVGESERVRGGTWLLRAQAICPAWAYYQFRLGAARLEQPVEGIDARMRGTLLHDAMEQFWGQVNTSRQLRAMSEEDRRAKIAEAVNHVLSTDGAGQPRSVLKPRLKALEQERLQRLIGGWLELELVRPHEFEVIAHERKVEVEIQGIQVRMSVDRIDRLEDGSVLVIDYKTGAAIDTSNWASERLTEPQLPIYAAIQPPAEGEVQAVVFAKVLLQDPGWAGLAGEDIALPSVPAIGSKAARKLFNELTFPDWASVMAHWRTRIHAVASEVKAGHAAVQFESPKALRYCDVAPLLRLEEWKAQGLSLEPQPTEVAK